MRLQVLIPRFNPSEPRSAIENMKLLANGCDADLLAFLHDDVTIYEPDWEGIVEDFMEHRPECGLLGFGGALGLGTADIYKTPYRLQQLARIDYWSNVRDAEVHGRRATDNMRVTMLDGFALIFRRAAYVEMGGWQALLNMGLTFHMYDFAACCIMQRLGWEVWMLPMDCQHHGGGTSVSREYDEWLRSQGIAGDSEVHAKAHEICYREFRDVLPWRL